MSTKYMPFNIWMREQKNIVIKNFAEQDQLYKVFELEYQEWCIDNEYDDFDELL